MLKKIVFTALGLVLASGIAFAGAPKVAADIAPIHSLVSKVMDGVGAPDLIIPAGASPHQYQLRPSEAKSLQDAKIVFWVGEDLSPWLQKTIFNLNKDASITALLEVNGIKLLDFRESALFEQHDHSDHGSHESHAKKKESHEDHHDHGKYDPHAWLSPEIAKVWLNVIARKLSEVDPDNATTYFKNAKKARQDLDALSKEINKKLDPIRNKKFIVFHDAYQYFENDFKISASGAIALGDATAPSPARLAIIRQRVKDEAIQCVLAEPQFKEGLVRATVQGTNSNIAVIDPLGVSLKVGVSLYDNLILNLANNLVKCF